MITYEEINCICRIVLIITMQQNIYKNYLARFSASQIHNGHSRFRGHFQIQTCPARHVHLELDFNVFRALSFPSCLSTHMLHHPNLHGCKTFDVWLYKFCTTRWKLQNNQPGPRNLTLEVPTINRERRINSSCFSYSELQRRHLVNCRDS